MLNANHPKRGDTIKVEPIRTVNAINKIKANLSNHPRNFALFVMGINTAFRASELLSIRVGQIRDLKAGDRLDVKQRKTRKFRAVTINRPTSLVLQELIEWREKQSRLKKDLGWIDDDSYLFSGKNPQQALKVPTLNNFGKRLVQKSESQGELWKSLAQKNLGFYAKNETSDPYPTTYAGFWSRHATANSSLSLYSGERDRVYLYINGALKIVIISYCKYIHFGKSPNFACNFLIFLIPIRVKSNCPLTVMISALL